MEKEPVISKSTLRGTLIFIILLCLIFVLPDLLTHFSEPVKVHIRYENAKTQEQVSRLKRNYTNSRKFERRSRYNAPLQAFDPNTYTAEQWMALGLSEKQTAVVLKFTSRGIYSNEDLKRIFVISDELFALIKDSTVYPPRPEHYSSEHADKPAAKSLIVNVNTATEEELLQVKGIGPFFAKQILRRRDQLGGFVDKTQLLEVWKMDQEKLDVIAPSLSISPDQVRKININTATVDELKIHPYISWNLANSIVKLRSQIGGYKQISDVKKSVLMTDELYEKLKRYLTLEE